jgi:hypothetical protein
MIWWAHSNLTKALVFKLEKISTQNSDEPLQSFEDDS